MGEVKDEDIEVPDNVPEKSRKYYIQAKKLKAQADAKALEAINLEKKVNKTEEDEKKLKQLDKEHRELHDKWQEMYDRGQFGGITGDEYRKRNEKIEGFLKKIAKYSCAQKSENNKLCVENFMKCGQRCINVTDEDLIQLDKLEKGGDVKKVMEYVKKNILDELNQGACRTEKDVDSLVEVDGKKVLKEKSDTCYEMISNYF